jgi:hypothetical protein
VTLPRRDGGETVTASRCCVGVATPRAGGWLGAGLASWQEGERWVLMLVLIGSIEPAPLRRALSRETPRRTDGGALGTPTHPGGRRDGECAVARTI